MRHRLSTPKWNNRGLHFLIALAVCGSIVTPAFAQKKQAAASNSASAGSGSGILPGSNSKDPVNIDAGKLDYYDKEQKLVYTGNVVAVQGESRLLTPTLVIFLMPKEAGSESSTPSSTNNQVRRMEASGPVTLSQKDQVGTGDSGVYIKAENKVYLYGNVTLTQGPNVTKGDKLVYDLSTSQAVVTGKRVNSLFVPNNNNGSGNDDNGPKKTSRSVGSSQNAGSSPN
jgi:lipopolysaccharide export system protein LptA